MRSDLATCCDLCECPVRWHISVETVGWERAMFYTPKVIVMCVNLDCRCTRIDSFWNSAAQHLMAMMVKQ